MGLEELLDRIKEQTGEQTAKVIADAKQEAERIIQEARTKADSIKSQAKIETERDAHGERLRSVATARLGAKRQLLQAQEEVLQGFEVKVLDSIDEFVKSEEYKKFLTRVVDDGVAKIGKDSVVHVNSRDRAFLEERKVAFKMSEKHLNSRGGALVASADGKRRVDNTIEAILHDKKDELRLKLGEQIFGA